MLNQQIYQSIECAIAHKCAKDANEPKRCAHCEIGYKFIVMEPESLKCGHNICKECESKAQNKSIKCKLKIY